MSCLLLHCQKFTFWNFNIYCISFLLLLFLFLRKLKNWRQRRIMHILTCNTWTQLEYSQLNLKSSKYLYNHCVSLGISFMESTLMKGYVSLTLLFEYSCFQPDRLWFMTPQKSRRRGALLIQIWEAVKYVHIIHNEQTIPKPIADTALWCQVQNNN